MGMYLMRQIGREGQYQSDLPDFMVFLNWKELPWHWALSDSLIGQLFLALVKNPVGFTEVLRTVLAPPGRRTLLIAINDLFADGTDVSWLWDVEFERLQERVNVAVCAGLRAEDMAVRLKYAGVEPDRIRVENDLRRALELALAAAEPNETVYVLPTYTAMLAMRQILQRTGYVRGFWED